MMQKPTHTMDLLPVLHADKLEEVISQDVIDKGKLNQSQKFG